MLISLTFPDSPNAHELATDLEQQLAAELSDAEKIELGISTVNKLGLTDLVLVRLPKNAFKKFVDTLIRWSKRKRTIKIKVQTDDGVVEISGLDVGDAERLMSFLGGK